MSSQASASASLIRFAVVGLGSAGTGRVRVLLTEDSKNAGFELKAVVSRRPPPEDIAHLAKPLDEVLKGEIRYCLVDIVQLGFPANSVVEN